ncbi:LLM class flavin-dependent oxidoreductase [Allokutzneria sp. A3M-2-11 16]|uniref:LLM class flavin-dependent oxidoreductase n=1 Tax=Allokutzneria sp. A3M-2-11 16 TaxID=2962043 RepID=UPI0020B6A78D|nr:LLM class flavin-dependent oxidoreductase [Allokutzneria sp. A3M-2-11 16]MCP3798415.1 LLM class flavin-dependent oxidoreductase [Allokutzneria sp. A3M-2-11 16]
MRLSVLDTSPIVAGSTAQQALRNTVDLAGLADQLGFHRYWVPEHHGMRGVASSAPAVLVAELANATRNLRVGSGGVLLPNHAPIVVAEQFGTLEALHPGRIDLGIGRAPGGPPSAVEVVRGGRTEKTYDEQLDELLSYFTPDSPAIPAIGNAPPIWLLGSSPASAQLAGARGLRYAFAHHLNPAATAEAARTYRGPEMLVSVSVIVADTDERAEWLAGSTRLKVLSRIRGTRIRLPSPEDAAAYPYTEDDRAEIAARSGSVLVGSPETVTRKLRAVLDDTGVDELMVTSPIYHHHDRLRSYDLLASTVD